MSPLLGVENDDLSLLYAGEKALVLSPLFAGDRAGLMLLGWALASDLSKVLSSASTLSGNGGGLRDTAIFTSLIHNASCCDPVSYTHLTLPTICSV